MTTTTRTTRKAPWAVFLTALLAALAMVLGSLVIAAPANAKDNPNKPDNPGNSATAPGHQDDTVLPPGQDPDFVPPGQVDRPDTDKKVWICHADTNKGNGQPNLGVNGTGGELGIGFNLIYISVNAAENAHFKLHPNDTYALNNGSTYYCPGAPDTVRASVCVANADGTFSTVTFAYLETKDITTGVSDPGNIAYSTFTVVEAAKCIPSTPTPTPKSAEYCAALTGTETYGLVTFTGTEGTDEAGWLNGTTPKSAYTIDVSKVKCLTPEAAAALDAAVAAAVPQPATVAGAPATIKVPAKGPTIPATVPAGDGSTVPTTPVAALTFLVLAATALAASTVRLVGAKR